MMEVIHHLVLKVLRIYKAMKSLVYRVKTNQKFILGLAERWCFKTICFVFLLDESTVTLEDMIIVGRCSVLGDSILFLLQSAELVEIKENL